MALEEIRTTGGFNATLVTYLQDQLGDLAGATVKAALVPEGATWPASSSPLWKPCTVTVTDGVARVAQVVSTPEGHCHWWLWVQDGAANAVVLVMDPDDTERPWHIYAH